jgi:hypothetical protein
MPKDMGQGGIAGQWQPGMFADLWRTRMAENPPPWWPAMQERFPRMANGPVAPPNGPMPEGTLPGAPMMAGPGGPPTGRPFGPMQAEGGTMPSPRFADLMAILQRARPSLTNRL